MKASLFNHLLRRELGETSRPCKIPGIYGSREWVDDLDIVNELGGHTGCVNALCWSRSGRLLASGSDDTYLNIYSYQPESSTAPFSLNTTLATGHGANIFSVKFMPHSNDRTLVTCAGDSEVRVFDVEYSGRNANAGAFAASARSRRITDFFTGARYLNARNTNARIYRSHSDRVKRIVTESSPYLFLTCSEDGEVRQWDLRQPSSAYPAPPEGEGLALRLGTPRGDSGVPPLISYKRYHVDLNTISCVASQPYYIALGGAHPHCFLHDRRMTGRDILAERGQIGGSSPIAGHHDDDLMAQATRCVRRFAPNGQKKMRRNDNGHITACKISDVNPNEMVVSWSGDHIYSFDLTRSPDARESKEKNPTLQRGSTMGRRVRSRNKKRKRGNATSISSLASGSGNRPRSRARTEDLDENSEMTIRVRHGNGNSESIPVPSLPPPSHEAALRATPYSVLNAAQRLSLCIAQGLVKLRRTLFSLEASTEEPVGSEVDNNPTPYTASFTAALGYASTYLQQMDEAIRDWGYPLNPTEDEVIFQQTLRRNRESTRRFIQASGTLSRVLGGRLRTLSRAESPQVEMFRQIVPAPTENGIIDENSQFGYDFLKGILLWLEGGRESLLNGFKAGPANRHNKKRFPIREDADDDAIEEVLIPYLHSLAGIGPIKDLEASKSEPDEPRRVFESKSAAVTAFGNAIKLPLERLGMTAARTENLDGPPDPSNIRALDRHAAIRFWGFKVGMGVLMDVGEGVNFEFVNRAFGGIRTAMEEDCDEDDERVRAQEDQAQPSELHDSSSFASTHRRKSSAAPSSRAEESVAHQESSSKPKIPSQRVRRTDNPGSDVEMSSAVLSTNDETENIVGHESRVDKDNRDEDEDDSGDGEEGHDGDDESDEQNMRESDEESEIGRTPSRIGGFRHYSRYKEDVERHAPCSSHVNVYRGHCNVKTVKDVNYFGLDDQYVVSGSDCKHFFIWDRKTAKLVNILEGDGEIVNVVQGHPYEPTIAVSGIDNTVKIFSPDRRAQDEAGRGINVLNPESAADASVGRAANLRSRKRMQDSYAIMNQNDVDRQGAMNDAYVTRSMFAQIAAALRERPAIGGIATLAGEPGEGPTFILDENCLIM